MAERIIREFRKKISDIGSNTFSDFGTFPIGTEGIYTNMFSGLNLEEELRIGGEKETEIQQLPNEGCIQTTTKYFLPGSNKLSYYKLVIRQYTTINRFLFDPVQSSESDPYGFIVNEYDQFIVFPEKPEEVPLNDKFIRISLYTSYFRENAQIGQRREEKLIKEKLISYNKSTRRKTVITEQIWEDPSLENNTSNNEGD